MHYIKALRDSGIPYFAPRARRFFENEEICLMIACYAFIFSFCGETLCGFNTKSFDTIRTYLYEAEVYLKRCRQASTELEHYLQRRLADINNLNKDDTLDMHILDYFYDLLACSPFSQFCKDQTAARNLAKLSQLLESFQTYYHVEVVTGRNKQWIPNILFASFLKFLLDVGIDDYENSDNPVPAGHVQIMTVHQSKGLEFPVVVVGSLNMKRSTINVINKELQPFYHRKPFEPEDRINEFDLTRQHYVAFSRAARLLVLTTTNKCNYLTDPIWKRLIRRAHLSTNGLSKQKFHSKKHFIPKTSFSLTTHINTFELCPQKYQFHIEHEFSPSRSASRTFGSLVHQTIEDIHNVVLKCGLAKITNESIQSLFRSNYRSLISIGMRPLSKQHIDIALDHILDYFNQNYDLLSNIVKSEEEISIEKPRYIITGKIDLLLKTNDNFEIIDFKTEQKPNDGDPLLQRYYKQLYLYAYIFKEKYGMYPRKLIIYWTSQRDRDQALTEVSFDDNDIRSAAEYFDNIANRIQNKMFKIENPPEEEVCNECDFRKHCIAQGIFAKSLLPRSTLTIVDNSD
jgi:DNA helicase-2/ATP-dependent DNA helicase PcrA